MSQLSDISPLIDPSFQIHAEGDVVRFTGVLSMRNPSDVVTPFLRRVHAIATSAGMKQVTVDIVQLRFMNSSSIRSLVDWVEWIRGEPEGKRYVLDFLTKSDVLWQKTTLMAIQAFGGQQVVVRRRG
jgi:hypothetical protein